MESNTEKKGGQDDQLIYIHITEQESIHSETEVEVKIYANCKQCQKSRIYRSGYVQRTALVLPY